MCRFFVWNRKGPRKQCLPALTFFRDPFRRLLVPQRGVVFRGVIGSRWRCRPANERTDFRADWSRCLLIPKEKPSGRNYSKLILYFCQLFGIKKGALVCAPLWCWPFGLEAVPLGSARTVRLKTRFYVLPCSFSFFLFREGACIGCRLFSFSFRLCSRSSPSFSVFLFCQWTFVFASAC